MSEIAFVSTPELILGAAESGLRPCPVESAELLEEKLLALAQEGVSLVVVTEDLMAGRAVELKGRFRKSHPRMAIFVVPRRGEGAREYLASLRESFATALGVDVWVVTAKRKGVVL